MRIFVWSLAFFAVIAAAVFLPPIATLGIFSVIIALWLIERYLPYATIILIFLYPFLGLVIDFSTIESLRKVAVLGTIQAPLTDIFGLFIFAAWLSTVMRLMWQGISVPGSLRKHLESVRLPAFLPAISFWASGALSLVHVPELWLGGSIKYLFRPIGFFYAVFVVPIVNTIRSERFLRLALWAMWLAGFVAALFGVASFFVAPSVGFPRATVFSIFGIAPLGTNHNLLAETLVVTAPLGLALIEWYTRPRWRRFILLGSALQVTIALLTFARTAWIVLVVQAFIWSLTVGHVKAKDMARRLKPALAIFIPLAIVMAIFSLSEVVQSSTMTRADMARISLFYWHRAPIIGQGVGTYVPSLWTIKAFTRDYGEPLEAHGVAWKLLFEQGVLGLVTFSWLVVACLYKAYKAWRVVYWSSGRAIMGAVLMMMSGAAVYQVFNTMYYTSKLWVPMGVGLAATYIYGSSKHTA